MWKRIETLAFDEGGQDIVEYVLLCAAIGLVVFGGINTFGTQMDAIYTRLAATLNGLF